MAPGYSVRAVALLGIGVLLGACGQSTPARGSLTVATAPSSHGSGSHLALLEGVLAGTGDDSSACFWVVHLGQRVTIQWPHGWSASPAPLQVLDSRGRVVAKVGDRVSLTGGRTVDGQTVTYCEPQAGGFSAALVERMGSAI